MIDGQSIATPASGHNATSRRPDSQKQTSTQGPAALYPQPRSAKSRLRQFKIKLICLWRFQLIAMTTLQSRSKVVTMECCCYYTTNEKGFNSPQNHTCYICMMFTRRSPMVNSVEVIYILKFIYIYIYICNLIYTLQKQSFESQH